jgi:polyisoprenoid-binding protein YceI
VSAVIDAASFATGNPQRDKDVKSARFLHVRDHPQITFRSTELVRDGDAWRLRGQITARGTTAPAELTIGFTGPARRLHRRRGDPRS